MNTYDALPQVLRSVCAEFLVAPREVVDLIARSPGVSHEFIAQQIRHHLQTIEKNNRETML